MRVGISLPVRELGDDLSAIRDFAQAAEALGLTHLRIPDQVLRDGQLHEPLTLLSYIAGVTSSIELVPSVIVLPLRQTVLVAKQTATIDALSGGRLRLGVGVGTNKAEYTAMGIDFHRRGARCDEQLELLPQLWTGDEIEFEGKFHSVCGGRINPPAIQQPIPVWIGAASVPSDPVVNRIGRFAHGWFVLATPEDFADVKSRIDTAAQAHGRNPSDIGTEAGVAVVGPREHEWRDRVQHWHDTGLTHLCLRTLGGGIKPGQHVAKMREAVADLPI
jgi:probable F420-dependent oxidoreductase